MSEVEQGGHAVARALRSLGVRHLFTLTGGHIFPILAGCRDHDIGVVDVRHEQSAAYAAEGWARLTRSVGVAAVTAGPGVTNAMSAMAQARFNRAPLLVLAGRAPMFRWGQGSLQEIDHVPFVDPVAAARTVSDTAAIAGSVVAAAAAADTPPRGPRFLDFPLDVLFNQAEVADVTAPEPATVEPDEDEVGRLAEAIESARRPVLVAGGNVWLDRGEEALRNLAESAELPVFMNGQGRGCLPADHRLAFARSRSVALKDADLVIVAGTPLDFRLNFGDFGPGTKVVHLESAPELIATHVELYGAIGAPLGVTLQALADALEKPADTKRWLEVLREGEERKRGADAAGLGSDATPIHPLRVYGELMKVLERDAVIVGDGGDFVSFAGRVLPSYEPGCWLDPGPFGCLGAGPGYALAACLAHPQRRVVMLLGDGALGFSATELETFVRHRLPVVAVVGNNGIWGLEKHPMRGLYGFDVAADLQPGLRYELLMEAFGGRGETVSEPDGIGPALRRAFDAGEPYLVNVLTDPEVAYPRSANLA